MLGDIIFWVIFGGIVGLISSRVMGADARVNGAMNIVLGIVGAVVGGFLVSLFGGTGVTGFNIYSFIVAIIGAVVAIWLYRFFARSA
jgi:uncharacterized membrane protein YeaQ/YmgE (transglycosylase-associated protein family)